MKKVWILPKLLSLFGAKGKISLQQCLQSDHGPESAKWFLWRESKKSHRYTRIGKPNDNAHVIDPTEAIARRGVWDHVPRNGENQLALPKNILNYTQYRTTAHGNFIFRPNTIIKSRPIRLIDYEDVF